MGKSIKCKRGRFKVGEFVEVAGLREPHPIIKIKGQRLTIGHPNGNLTVGCENILKRKDHYDNNRLVY